MTGNWWADQLADRLSEVSGRPRPSPSVRSAPPKPPAFSQADTKPQAEEEHCPSCNSGNYMATPPSKYMRCYDCGYPVVQSGTGVVSTKSDAPAKKAVQVPSGGYSPTTIVGRIE